MNYKHHNSQHYHIRELDLDMIRPSAQDIDMDTKGRGMKLTVIGKPGTGKTHLITSILYAKRHLIPCSMVVSGTEDSNHHYSNMIPSSFIYNRLDLEDLTRFISRQKVALKYVNTNPWALLLLDDCMDEPKHFNNKVVQYLYKNGRHLSMLYILSLQYCMDIRPAIRNNVDGTFILRESNIITREKIWKNYAGIIPDFTLFCSLMDQLTTDYTALYIHNAGEANNLEDCVFWYRAPRVIPPFRMGCPEFWQFHYDRYNEDYEDELKF